MVATFPAYLLMADILLPPSNIWTIFAAAIQMYVVSFPVGSATLFVYVVSTVIFTIFVFHGIYKRAAKSRLWSDYVLMWIVYSLVFSIFVYFFVSVAYCDLDCVFAPNEPSTTWFGRYFRWAGTKSQTDPAVTVLNTRQAMVQIHDQLNNTGSTIDSACSKLNQTNDKYLRLGLYEEAKQYKYKAQTCALFQDLFKQHTSELKLCLIPCA